MIVPTQFPSTLPCKIAFVGEAPGAEEEVLGLPLVGASGKFLLGATRKLGIPTYRQFEPDLRLFELGDNVLTNVFTTRPRANDVTQFFRPRLKGDNSPYPFFYHENRVYVLKEENHHEIERLKKDLIQASPNLIVSLGATALWSLCGTSGIGTYRGYCMAGTLVKRKVLPTFHPAAILREWGSRVYFYSDLKKAITESHVPTQTIPSKTTYVAESAADIALYRKLYLANPEVISFDVEVSRSVITHIALAATPERCLCIPFGDLPHEELAKAWAHTAQILEGPGIKVAQNALYDLTLLENHGIKVRGRVDDTMLMHHALQPELSKDLGTLGSLYINVPEWKSMRVGSKAAEKKDA